MLCGDQHREIVSPGLYVALREPTFYGIWQDATQDKWHFPEEGSEGFPFSSVK
jgi:hypothetical protein